MSDIHRALADAHTAITRAVNAQTAADQYNTAAGAAAAAARPHHQKAAAEAAAEVRLYVWAAYQALAPVATR